MLLIASTMTTSTTWLISVIKNGSYINYLMESPSLSIPKPVQERQRHRLGAPLPRQPYQPYQFFHAAAESLVKWEPREYQYNHALGADAISLHIREWFDTPGLHQPNVCWRNGPQDRWNVRRALRRCGYWMWDDRRPKREDKDGENAI